jgi:hypothetical protein
MDINLPILKSDALVTEKLEDAERWKTKFQKGMTEIE